MTTREITKHQCQGIVLIIIQRRRALNIRYCRQVSPSRPMPLKSVAGSLPWKPMSCHCLVILSSSSTLGYSIDQSCEGVCSVCGVCGGDGRSMRVVCGVCGVCMLVWGVCVCVWCVGGRVG